MSSWRGMLTSRWRHAVWYIWPQSFEDHATPFSGNADIRFTSGAVTYLPDYTASYPTQHRDINKLHISTKIPRWTVHLTSFNCLKKARICFYVGWDGQLASRTNFVTIFRISKYTIYWAGGPGYLVGKTTGYGVDGREVGVRVLEGASRSAQRPLSLLSSGLFPRW
jgi:hypothetical protein